MKEKTKNKLMRVVCLLEVGSLVYLLIILIMAGGENVVGMPTSPGWYAMRLFVGTILFIVFDAIRCKLSEYI